jgi:hypothetical protein
MAAGTERGRRAQLFANADIGAIARVSQIVIVNARNRELIEDLRRQLKIAVRGAARASRPTLEF